MTSKIPLPLILLTSTLLLGCPVYITQTPAVLDVPVASTRPRVRVIPPTTPTYVYGNSGSVNPIIQSFTANPNNVIKVGEKITFQVSAFDSARSPLQYNWSSTDGILSTNAGQMVIWQAPQTPGTYTVMVGIANQNGGYVSASLNVLVDPNTTPATSQPTSQPTVSPSPLTTPTASSSPVSSSTPTPSPSPSVN
jgi:hypothetical protein